MYVCMYLFTCIHLEIEKVHIHIHTYIQLICILNIFTMYSMYVCMNVYTCIYA